MEGEYYSSKKEVLEISRYPSSTQQPYPWLVLCAAENKKRQIFYSITEDHYHIKFIPELQNKSITCSDKRWLAMQDESTSQCFLLNTSTKEKLILPPMEDILYYNRCIFSSPVVSGTCRVVFLNSLCLSTLLSCNLGDSEYTEREVTLEGGVKGDSVEAAINFQGKLYALTYYFILVRADFADPNLHFTRIINKCQIPEELHTFDVESKLYLVEHCGDLLFVYTRFCNRELEDLKILRADLVKREWVMVESLGDGAIFLDAYNSYSSPASLGLKGNCVYYVNKCGRNLFVYHLEDKSITMSLPCPIAKSNSFPSWMSGFYE